jgi:hypothetical protein
MNDPHSPQFWVSQNVLTLPFWATASPAKFANEKLHEIYEGTTMASQYAEQVPVSALKHCLIRYILDIGETGLSKMVLRMDTGAFINWHLDKEWGKTKTTCNDKIVRFFNSRMPSLQKSLEMRCMVLANKTALQDFLSKLDMPAIERMADVFNVMPQFIDGMKDRREQIQSALKTFEAKDLLVF